MSEAQAAGGPPTKGRVHMVGIGGAGMSALARIYLEQGLAVSGSDKSASRALDDLVALGARAYAGSDPAAVAGAGLVVYSSAVPESDPELTAARSAGIRTVKHAVALGELFNKRRGIAVAGTHGKTTTSSIAALVLERAGYEPAFQIGGELVDLGTSARWGKGEWMVVEADEFDRRFLEYTPEIAVIGNVEPDHFEYYGTYEAMRDAFGAFLDRVQPGGSVVAWADDTRLAGLLAERPSLNVVRFRVAGGSQTPGSNGAQDRSAAPVVLADFEASDVELFGEGSRFTVTGPGGQRERIELAIPGEHNVRNALAALGAVYVAGVSVAQAARTLAEFHGARRRLELLADADGIRVFDDYAHHPTAVRLMIEAMRRQVKPGGRLWAVFQPHLRTRTEELFEEFTTAFGGADEVLLTDVYSPAGREPEGSYRGTPELLQAAAHPRGRHAPTLEDARRILRDEVRPGDVVLIMGAGSIERLAREVAQDVKGRVAGDA